ncbi:hypothetical protein CULT_300033 [[Clostridium] ultunense Esp]|nr:hypothetical protein CULT_300033 [[Clostridium] ultunense Esp]
MELFYYAPGMSVNLEVKVHCRRDSTSLLAKGKGAVVKRDPKGGKNTGTKEKPDGEGGGKGKFNGSAEASEAEKGAPDVGGIPTEKLQGKVQSEWMHIWEELLMGTYRPMPASQIEIPKKSGKASVCWGF